MHLNVLKGLFASEYKHGAMNEASGGLLVHQRRPCLVRQNIYEMQTDGLGQFCPNSVVSLSEANDQFISY